jgi:hypothetical protein
MARDRAPVVGVEGGIIPRYARHPFGAAACGSVLRGFAACRTRQLIIEGSNPPPIFHRKRGVLPLFLWMAVVAVYCKPVSGIFPVFGKSTGNFCIFLAYPNHNRRQFIDILVILFVIRSPQEFVSGNYQGICRCR